MSQAALAVPATPLAGLSGALAVRGHAVLVAADFARFASASIAELDALRPSWDALPPDLHLRDGGRYRRRRHSSFVLEGNAVQLVPQRAHWQLVPRSSRLLGYSSVPRPGWWGRGPGERPALRQAFGGPDGQDRDGVALDYLQRPAGSEQVSDNDADWVACREVLHPIGTIR